MILMKFQLWAAVLFLAGGGLRAEAGTQTNWYDCATLVADGKITLEGKGWTNGAS